MKIRNLVVIGAIFVIFYVAIGSTLVDFYFGGKEAILKMAEKINKQCNENGVCPKVLNGWTYERDGMLRNGNMLYFFSSPNTASAESQIGPQSFRIVYALPMPDDWFEVQGGVGMPVTSGWKSR